MPDQCPYLEYRPLSDAANSGDSEKQSRAYCTAADQFVQPMRADVCNDRYDLDHETDCEIFRDAEGLPEVPDAEGNESAGTDDETGGASE